MKYMCHFRRLGRLICLARLTASHWFLLKHFVIPVRLSGFALYYMVLTQHSSDILGCKLVLWRYRGRNERHAANCWGENCREIPTHIQSSTSCNSAISCDRSTPQCPCLVPSEYTYRRATSKLCQWCLELAWLIMLQKAIWKSLKIIEPVLRMDNHTRNWRQSSKHFRNPNLCQLKPGTVSMSPAWFQQGHEVHFFPLIMNLI